MSKKLSVVSIIFVMAIFSKQSFGAPLPITIYDTRYTTSLYLKAHYTDRSWPPPVEYTSESRSKFSQNPINDYMHIETFVWSDYPYHDTGPTAAAEAERFQISTYTDAPNWDPGDYAFASAKTEMKFSPLIDASKMIEINFEGWYEWYYSRGYVSLFDITVNEYLWSYGWVGMASHDLSEFPSEWSAVPWDPVFESGGPNETAELSVNSNFLASHTYLLSMYADTNANGDSQRINIQLSGLQAAPVPEPATMLLLASGLVGLAGLRRKFKK